MPIKVNCASFSKGVELNLEKKRETFYTQHNGGGLFGSSPPLVQF